MSTFKIDQKTIKSLEDEGKNVVNELADDAKEKLCSKYESLIDFYYADYMPKLDRKGNPYYIRTFNLYKSYRPYKRNPHNTIYYGGITVTADKMHDYSSFCGETFSAQRLLDKYIYTTTLPSATWHGGDWHGGYGKMNSFSIYKEMLNYQQYLIKYYTDNFGIK